MKITRLTFLDPLILCQIENKKLFTKKKDEGEKYKIKIILLIKYTPRKL